MKSIKSNDSGLLAEECQQISIDDFVVSLKANLKDQMLKSKFTIDGHPIALTTSKLSHGGLRYWFKCPVCSKRVGKLYKHPLNHQIACRKCHKLTYRSRRYKGMIESKS